MTAIPCPEDFVVLFKGNSITEHGTNPDVAARLGWTRICGMAASDAAHDYAHLLASALAERMPRHRIRAYIGRGGDDERALLGLDREVALSPDLVVLQGGEHAAHEPRWRSYEAHFEALLSAMEARLPGPPKVLCIGPWNPTCREEFTEAAGADYALLAPRIEEIQRNLAARHGAAFASVAPFQNDPACTGDGDTPGVRFHPTDAGHGRYAQAALDAIQSRWPELLSTATFHQ